MIQFEKISFSYNSDNNVFKDLNWNIDCLSDGNFIHFILSPSGYGKSTLFKLILKTISPQKGEISIDNTARIAYVPQEPILFEHLSIYDNATFFKNIRTRKKEFNSSLFEEFANVLGLDDSILKSNKKISQLSGGQKRKLSLLKALSLNPNILLLDEPTSGLDAQVKMELLLQLKELAYKHKIVVLYITHHFEEALLIGDKIHYLMKSESGIIDRISTQSINDFKIYPPCLEAAYLVDYPKKTIEVGNLVGGDFEPNEFGNYYKRTVHDFSQIFYKNGILYK